jgi:hypothetical protein
MTEKLSFTPIEEHVVLNFNLKESKLTPSIEIDIALRILDKQDAESLEKFFRPVYNAMIEEKMRECYTESS